MAFPRSIILKRIAIGAVAAISTLSMASAQAPDGAQPPAGAQGQGEQEAEVAVPPGRRTPQQPARRT